ncbi:unnamed protein product [Amoebophrya sp. A120]|nr:unnamed protein product [Amoebophrya sp. A120]|eukprot:GSA120T00002405001.1
MPTANYHSPPMGGNSNYANIEEQPSATERARLLEFAEQAKEGKANAEDKKSSAPDVDNESWLAEQVQRRPVLMTIFWIGLMLCCSAGLISYNKYLIHGPFPFAIALTCWHMVCCTLFAWALYAVKPSYFPTAQVIRAGTAQQAREYLYFMIPLAICFSCGVVLSNVAYKYATIPFLQMMKELNVVIVYCMSLCVGMEIFQCRLVSVLAVIVLGSYFSITGEAKFVFLGFLVQGGSQFFECTRLVTVSKVLSNNSWGIKRVDPLSFLLLVSPVSFLLLSFVLVFTWETAIATSFVENWQALVGNGLTALLLNIVTTMMMSAFSALTFVVAGVMKDCCIVACGMLFFGESITAMQAGGFAVQVTGCGLYSYLKASTSLAAIEDAKKKEELDRDFNSSEETTLSKGAQDSTLTVSTDDDAARPSSKRAVSSASSSASERGVVRYNHEAFQRDADNYGSTPLSRRVVTEV